MSTTFSLSPPSLIASTTTMENVFPDPVHQQIFSHLSPRRGELPIHVVETIAGEYLYKHIHISFPSPPPSSLFFFFSILILGVEFSITRISLVCRYQKAKKRERERERERKKRKKERLLPRHNTHILIIAKTGNISFLVKYTAGYKVLPSQVSISIVDVRGPDNTTLGHKAIVAIHGAPGRFKVVVCKEVAWGRNVVIGLSEKVDRVVREIVSKEGNDGYGDF
jgi:hypothetical protein